MRRPEARFLQHQVLSEAPRVQYYPALLSNEDVNALVALASAKPDAWLDGGAGAPTEYSFCFLPPLQRFFHDAVRRLEARVAAATGVAPHAGEDPLKLSRHRPADDACPPQLLNLHVDANAARPRRFATLILYLSDARGGGTFFPCARANAASCNTSAAVRDGQPGHSLRSALHALHAAGVCMLPAAPDAAGSEAEEAALAAASALCARLAAEQDASGAPWVTGDDGGLLVAPRRGSALLFWSAGSDAWHGAAAVLGGVKLAAQKFKESAPAADGHECDARA